jgi:hypothetical protein
MVIKKILNFVILSILALFVTMASAFSADVYIPYKTVFSTDEIASDVYVSGYACTTNLCTDVDDSASIELYSGNQATTCWSDYNAGTLSAPEFFSCMDSAKLALNYQEISNDGDYIVVKYDSTKSFGYLTYFSTSSDSYFVKYDRVNNFDCQFDTCFDNNYRNLEFVKGVNAIAEIGELNIVNTDNPLFPVQVTVPVTISETVCSAYQLSNPNWWRTTIPVGYSDYSSETDIKLTIKNDVTGDEYFTKRITTSILADNCASLTAFEWTPDSNLENTRVEFKVESDVVDSQVVSSVKDFAYAYETIYPADLDSTCYARIEDFMLSNQGSFDLNTEVTQIQVGETLFANFKTSAFRDETAIPMSYNFSIYFDDVSVLDKTNLASSVNLVDFNEDLTSSISGLEAGNHKVKVVVTPNGENCGISHNVTQIQNLIITEPETYDIAFRVLGTGAVELDGAKVNFDGMELFTESNGEVKFSNMDSGDYNYSVSYDGYQTKFGELLVASDIKITITLSEENSAPVVNFPVEFTDIYLNSIVVDTSEYIVDYNEAFDNLDVSISKISGDSNFGFNDGILTLVSSGKSEESEFTVTVTDSKGAVSSDTFKVIFTNNFAPEILEFSADVYDGYKVFTTNFNIDVTDVEGDDLVCTIDFEDTNVESGSCADLDGISHSFENMGDYNVVLTVTDSFGNVVKSDLDIYVYEESFRPYVDFFSMQSSNGNIVSTDLSLSWSAKHENPDSAIYCELYVNGLVTDVPCDGSELIEGFNNVGESEFEIVVHDLNDNDNNQVIIETFVNGSDVDNFKPIISSFIMDSTNGNYVPTDLTFKYIVSHQSNDDITCVISVNSDDIAVPCSLTSYDLDNYAREGQGTFILTVTDSDGDEVSSVIVDIFEKEVVENFKPYISSFDMVSSNGIYVPTNLSFNYIVGHENNEDISCVISVNLVDNLVPCSSPFDLGNFAIEGSSTFILTVTDLNDNEVSEIITRTFEKEVVTDYTPLITSFDMISSNSNFVPSDLDFEWVVSYSGNFNDLVCELFVNGVSNDINCNGRFDISDYDVAGNAFFKLVVTDLDGDEASEIIVQNFVDEPVVIDYKPFITSFEMNSSNGNLVSTNLTFNYVVGHENNESLICKLYVGSVSNSVDCNGSFEILEFNELGFTTFKLEVLELNGGDIISSELSNSFEETVIELESLGINLIADRSIELYEFDFSIEIEDETMAKRLVGLRPEIVCGGSRAVLSDMLTREMATGIQSSNDNIYVFDFKLDTRDFNLHIRPGSCILKVVLVDNYGASKVVSKYVEFKVTEEEHKVESIRGNGLDVMNYMQTALLGSVSKGYNDIQFTVHNNEDFSKKLSITFISPRLGFYNSQEIAVGAGSSSHVAVDLIVKSDVAPGMYPVKYSVNYGTEKYSRYSYIRIN